MTLPSLLPAWSDGLKTVAVALLRQDGQIVQANAGFRAMIEGEGHQGGQVLRQPAFSELALLSPDSDGLLYRGRLELGTPAAPWSGTIHSMNQMYFLVAEQDDRARSELAAELVRQREAGEQLNRQLRRCGNALEASRAELEAIKLQDILTGLANRKQLDVRTDAEIGRWERYRRPLAFILMDIDGFSVVNNELGREVADEVLHYIAVMLRHSVRNLDVVARFGGQEFAVLLPETNEMGALIVAERMRMDMESQIVLPLIEPITGSFGVAALIEGELRESLFGRTWRALRHAKGNGRNCVTLAGVSAGDDRVYQGAGIRKEKDRVQDD